MGKQKTHEEYLSELNDKNIKIIPLEKYINATTNIMHKCLICENEWSARPANILYGTRCPKCEISKRSNNMKKDNEYFLNKLPKEILDSVEILQEYQGSHKKIKCRCKKCSEYFYQSPDKLYKKTGCPSCGDKLGRHNKFIKIKNKVTKELLNNNDVKVLSEYTGAHDKMHFRCTTCNHDWFTLASNILNGHMCPKCAALKNGIRCRKTNEQFLLELDKINKFVEPLEEYKTSSTKIKCKCRNCNNIWEVTPANLLFEKGCPKCNITSLGERRIYNYLYENNIEFHMHYSFDDLIDKRKLSYDFYLQSYNTLIEFQGRQHYYPIDLFGGKEIFEIQIKHDEQKREYAAAQGINLLEISYLDIDKIDEILNKELNLKSVETAG